MSKKAKGISSEKIIKQFETADIDEQVRVFLELKEYLTAKVLEHATSLSEKAEKYLGVKDFINK